MAQTISFLRISKIALFTHYWSCLDVLSVGLIYLGYANELSRLAYKVTILQLASFGAYESVSNLTISKIKHLEEMHKSKPCIRNITKGTCHQTRHNPPMRHYI